MASPLIPHTDVAGMSRPAGTLDVATALRPYNGPWDSRLAAHLLRRAGFGATQDELQSAASAGVHGAVDRLVSAPQSNPAPPGDLYDPVPTIASFIASGGNLGRNDDQRRDLFKQIRESERQSILSLQSWWLQQMLSTRAPLQEKMALYFHGHFTTAAIQKGVSPTMAFAQNQLFRDYALGNLRELTWNVSIDPAMLLYLDNATNQASHPNENYARELMELFTLGVDHYTEEDVRESARAWTGWIVRPRFGKAEYVARRHDDGSKTFLGQTGNWSGRDIVDIIFKQPAAATFFSSSLLNFYLYNDPEPELIDAFARVIRKNDFNLKPALSVLLRSNVFYSARAYRALVKSPVEYVVGTYKALGIDSISLPAQRALAGMGQILFYPPNVAGWPGGSNWLTSQTMIARQNFAAALVNSPALSDGGWLQTVPLHATTAAQRIVGELLQNDASAKGVGDVAAYLNGAGTSALGMLSGENYQERVRGAAYLAMAMPAYQLN